MGELHVLPNAGPPKKPRRTHYAIRTGLRLTNDTTGKMLEVFMCSQDQNGGSHPAVASKRGRIRICCWADGQGGAPKDHGVISLMEALDLELLEVDEGGVLLSLSQLVPTSLRLAGVDLS